MAVTGDIASSNLKRRLIFLLALLLMLGVATILWTASPARDWLDIPRAVDALRRLGYSVGPLVAALVFAAASVIAIPLTFLTLVSIIALGPIDGVLCSLGGAALGGALTYGLGRHLGREALERMAGPRINILSLRLAHRGVLAVAAIRLVPVAPFAMVNMAIGISHISLGQFLLGTAVGMLPGAIGIALFVEQIVQAFRNPGPTAMILVSIVILAIIIGLLVGRRWINRSESPQPPPEGGKATREGALFP